MVQGAYTPWSTIHRPLYIYCLIHSPHVRLVIGALAYLGARREGRTLNDETRNFHDVVEAWVVIRLGVHAVKTPTMSTTINWSSLTPVVSLLVRDTRWICVQIRRSRGYPASLAVHTPPRLCPRGGDRKTELVKKEAERSKSR